MYAIRSYYGKTIDPVTQKKLGAAIIDVANIIDRALPGLQKEIRALIERYYTARDFLFIGRGLNFPVALEGALKLKEISYIHAEGYAAGELKHGPIALIDQEMPIVALVPKDSVYLKTVSNVEEIKARHRITSYNVCYTKLLRPWSRRDTA